MFNLLHRRRFLPLSIRCRLLALLTLPLRRQALQLRLLLPPLLRQQPLLLRLPLPLLLHLLALLALPLLKAVSAEVNTTFATFTASADKRGCRQEAGGTHRNVAGP